MRAEDLQSLKLAVELGNPDLYHGDINDGIFECIELSIKYLNHIEEIKEQLSEVKERLEKAIENLS